MFYYKSINHYIVKSKSYTQTFYKLIVLLIFIVHCTINIKRNAKLRSERTNIFHSFIQVSFGEKFEFFWSCTRALFIEEIV